MRRRASGSVGRGGGPRATRRGLFPPEPHGWQEGERDLAQQRVVVQAAPGAPLVVVETKFLLELLVRLLAAPARLDGRRELLEGGVRRVAGEVELALARGAVLAHEPALLAGQVLSTRRLRPVGDAHATRAERSPQRPLRAGAPRQRAERRVGWVGEQRRRRAARFGGHGVLAGRPPRLPGPGMATVTSGANTFWLGGMPSAQSRPSSSSAWRKAAALPYSASPSTQPKRTPWMRRRAIASSATCHFGRKVRSGGTPARSRRRVSPAQRSGRNRRKATGAGTWPRARVSDTSAWQFARLPSCSQYWRCTPTECRPCLTRAVSSTTSTASGPPTRRSACSARTRSSRSCGQGEAETKWCSCCTWPGQTRAAIGSTLLRSPGSSSPRM